MSNLPQIAKTLGKFPEVTAYVVTDDAGSLLDASGDVDAEALGAVHVVALHALDRCGASLGLGDLDRLTITAAKRAVVVTSQDEDVLGVYLDPQKPLGAFEKKLETVLKR